MRFWILLSLTVFATHALAERQSFPPTDEAGSDPDLRGLEDGGVERLDLGRVDRRLEVGE